MNDHQVTAATAIQLSPSVFGASTTELSKGLPVLRKRSGSGCQAGVVMIVTFARPCSGRPCRARRAGLGFRSAGGGDGLDPRAAGVRAVRHCWRPLLRSDHPLYLRIASIAAIRADFPVLRSGRQYLRPVSVFGEPFGPARAAELFGWSRILVDEEALCVVNPNGLEARGADVLVDTQLNPPGSAFTVIMNSAQAGGATAGDHPVGSQLLVRQDRSRVRRTWRSATLVRARRWYWSTGPEPLWSTWGNPDRHVAP